MKRFSEFSTREKCELACALTARIKELEHLMETRSYSPDMASWRKQEDLALELHNELYFEMCQKILSA